MTERGEAQGLDLVVVGDCNPDVLVLGDDVTPSFGQQEKLVEGIWMVVGGSAAITAVAAARLGLSVGLVAAVGADPAGEFLLGQLSREGVSTEAVAVREGVPTGMTVALSRGADRAILTALGAVASLTAQDVPAVLLTRARHVHIWGPGWRPCWRPHGRQGPPRRSIPTGIRPGNGVMTAFMPRWPRPMCCSPTRRRPCGSLARRPCRPRRLP
jgi:hypothetical protein